MYFKITKPEIVDKFKDISKRIATKGEQLRQLANSYDADLFIYHTGAREYCEFAGFKFRGEVPEGFCKPDKNGMQKPKKNNKEFWNKIDVPPVYIQEAMDLLNIPATGINKFKCPIGETNHLFAVGWGLTKDKAAVTFEFPDKYLKDCKPAWQRPEYAIEILSSEYSAITDN